MRRLNLTALPSPRHTALSWAYQAKATRSTSRNDQDCPLPLLNRHALTSPPNRPTSARSLKDLPQSTPNWTNYSSSKRDCLRNLKKSRLKFSNVKLQSKNATSRSKKWSTARALHSSPKLGAHLKTLSVNCVKVKSPARRHSV